MAAVVGIGEMSGWLCGVVFRSAAQHSHITGASRHPSSQKGAAFSKEEMHVLMEIKGGIPSEDDNAEESNDEEDLRVGDRKANQQGVDAKDSKG